MTAKHLMIIAGEASGDLHAGHLVLALKAQDPSLIFSGIGGEQMRAAGVHTYADLTKIAVIGFAEVLKHYQEFKRAFDLILDKIETTKPAAVILVDYPGFNLRLAKEIKQRGIRVIYYISPQVWAWKKNRVKLIKQYVDRMLVLFPFEKTFYEKMGVPVDFVGNPLVDTVQAVTTKAEFLASVGMTDYQFTVGLLPGSRPQEIERHLPTMLAAARRLAEEFPMLQFLVIKAPTIALPAIEKYTTTLPAMRLKIIQTNTYDAINACDVCCVASGTATLETALLLKPMIVIYKTSWLTWALAKCVIRIPNIALVNVVAEQRVVPELLQHNANPGRIARELKSILTDDERMEKITEELRAVREKLGEGKASQKAAQTILNLLINTA
ncbi:MAG: lipid-A-disaccharide synthase [Candidatus Omnitrophica bacterium]|nr:lipid-A-disaccharide synthase [Candidatus Omnitrophota bacterium]